VKKIIGPAKEFFRLRIVKLSELEEPSLDWADDVLYRRPVAETLGSIDSYVVEAVGIHDDLVIGLTEPIDSHAEALTFLEGAEDDLRESTLSDFKVKYFPK